MACPRGAGACFVLVFVLVVAVAGGACSGAEDPPARPSDAFCAAAARVDERLSAGAGIDEQVRLVRRLVRVAPAEIEREARVFLGALEAVQADPDDPTLRDDPDVRGAVDDVNRYANQACGLLEQDSGADARTRIPGNLPPVTA